MPFPICGSVECAPINPPYSAQVLTKQFIDEFKFPNLTREQRLLIALDISTREVFYLNETNSFCVLDVELQEICGLNSSANVQGWTYCILAESWPQNDLWGWMQNTSPTSSLGFDTIFPALCVCPNPGRAYYLPHRIRPQPRFTPQCPFEFGAVVLYSFLMFCTLIVLLLVLYDMTILIFKSLEKKNFGFKNFL